MKNFNIGMLADALGVEPNDFIKEVEHTMIAVATMHLDNELLNKGETKYIIEADMESGKQVRLTVEYL